MIQQKHSGVEWAQLQHVGAAPRLTPDQHDLHSSVDSLEPSSSRLAHFRYDA